MSFFFLLFRITDFPLDSGILHRFLHGGARHSVYCGGYPAAAWKAIDRYIIISLPIAAEADGHQWLLRQHYKLQSP